MLLTIRYSQHHSCTLRVIFEDLKHYVEESCCFATRICHHYFGYLLKTVLDYFCKTSCLQGWMGINFYLFLIQPSVEDPYKK